MKPEDICNNVLGNDKLDDIINELSSPQIKAILKEGGMRAKVPGSYVSRSKRLKIWSQRIHKGLAEDNEDLASELLQQWLLYHRRYLLIALLDRLEIKHQQGETDESFLVTCPREKILEAAGWLLETQDRLETRAYLIYIAYQQRTQVFEDWSELDA
jgi:hypothetical protein